MDLADFSPEELEALKNNPDLQALMGEAGSFPTGGVKDSLLKFFRDVLDLQDKDFDKISRVGNLKDGELGNLPLSTRDYLSLARYCDTEGLGLVSAYLSGQANVVLNTSLSRAATFLKLVVTQRKFSGVITPKSVSVKRGLFGDKVEESGGEE